MIFKTKAKNLIIEYASARVTVIDGVPIKTKAKKIKFKEGRFITDDSKLIKIIKDHWMFDKKRIVVFDPDEQKKLQLQSDVGKQMVDLMKETGLTLEQLKARVASIPKGAGTESTEAPKKDPKKSEPPSERVQGGNNTPSPKDAPAKSGPPAGNAQTNPKPGFFNKKKK